VTATWQIIEGDCRETLATLPAGSVQTCVTSPPYFGLRDYGHGGQIGLEPTPDEFVAALVGVFREVRRVLRDDGTAWLNLGSSYVGAATSGGCSPKSTLSGGGGRYRDGSKNEAMFNAASGGSDPSQSRRPQRAPACGTDGTEPPDSPAPDSACPDLCDGCRAATQSHHGRSGCTDRLPARGAQPPSPTDRDSEPPGSAREPRALRLTTLRRPPLRDPLSHLGTSARTAPTVGLASSVLRSSSRDARLCARTAEYTSGTLRSRRATAIRARMLGGWHG
jgi:hypothetical protein